MDAATSQLGLTNGDPGAAKALDTATTTRNANTDTSSGSGFRIASSRAQDGTDGWKTNWTLDASALDTWVAVSNVSTSKLHIWWGTAKTHSTAVDAWHTEWGDGSKFTVGDAAMTETATGTDVPCDLTSGSWTTNTDAQAATTITACR